MSAEPASAAEWRRNSLRLNWVMRNRQAGRGVAQAPAAGGLGDSKERRTHHDVRHALDEDRATQVGAEVDRRKTHHGAVATPVPVAFDVKMISPARPIASIVLDDPNAVTCDSIPAGDRRQI